MNGTPSPRVTGRTAVGRRRRRVRIELDDGSHLEVNPRVLESHPVAVGDPLDEATRARLVDADLRWRARDAAFSLLAARARSRRELGDRLRRKEFPKRVVEGLLDEFEDEGWLDDAAFARALVRDRVRLKPRAPIRLEQELRRKGVDPGVAAQAVERVFDEEEVAPADLAIEAALGWLRRQGDATRRLLGAREWSEDQHKAKRRLMGYLARRGFRGSVAITALDAARETARKG